MISYPAVWTGSVISHVFYSRVSLSKFALILISAAACTNSVILTPTLTLFTLQVYFLTICM